VLACKLLPNQQGVGQAFGHDVASLETATASRQAFGNTRLPSHGLSSERDTDVQIIGGLERRNTLKSGLKCVMHVNLLARGESASASDASPASHKPVVNAGTRNTAS
jgi:hypothetical protein